MFFKTLIADLKKAENPPQSLPEDDALNHYVDFFSDQQNLNELLYESLK